MEKVNEIVICKDNFEDEYDFQEEIAKVVMLLLNNDYIMTVRYDTDDKEMGIVCIDYESSHQEWGAPYPYWLYPQHAEAVENMKDGD